MEHVGGGCGLGEEGNVTEAARVSFLLSSLPSLDIPLSPLYEPYSQAWMYSGKLFTL